MGNIKQSAQHKDLRKMNEYQDQLDLQHEQNDVVNIKHGVQPEDLRPTNDNKGSNGSTT